jgi:hypothetical protein
VIEGLTHVTGQASTSEEAHRRKQAQRLLTALQANNTKPMVPLKREEIHDRRRVL